MGFSSFHIWIQGSKGKKEKQCTRVISNDSGDIIRLSVTKLEMLGLRGIDMSNLLLSLKAFNWNGHPYLLWSPQGPLLTPGTVGTNPEQMKNEILSINIA